MIDGLRSQARTAAAAVMLFGATAGAADALEISWTLTGPGATNISQAPGAVTFDYDYNGGSSASGTWTATGTALTAGSYVLDWRYSGFHAYFGVSAFLDVFGQADPVDPSLVDAGPQNCCTAPSGGFDYTGGPVTFVFDAGDTFGFSFGGANGDSNGTLRGALTLTGDVSTVPVPGALALALTGLAALGAAGARRRAA